MIVGMGSISLVVWKVAKGATLLLVCDCPCWRRSLDASRLTLMSWVVSWATCNRELYRARCASAEFSSGVYIPVLTSAE